MRLWRARRLGDDGVARLWGASLARRLYWELYAEGGVIAFLAEEAEASASSTSFWSFSLLLSRARPRLPSPLAA